MQKNVSLVVAALNEEELVGPTIDAIVKSCVDCLNNFELILINDGSTDRTGAIMDEFATKMNNVKVVHNTTPGGLGTALQTGLACAKHEHIMLLCGDGGVPGESLPPSFNKIGEADIIIPYMANLKRIKTPMRYLLSRTYTHILNILFWQNLRYYNGLPVYKTADLKRIKVISKGFAFQAEIITKLIKSGSTYVQVETLGAEKSNRSCAVTMKGFYEIGKILLNLVWEVFIFRRSEAKKRAQLKCSSC